VGSFTDFLELEVLDHVFGAAAYSAPATLYVGLSTTTITDAGGNITEPAGNNYARAVVTNNSTNFPAAAAGSKSNGTDINFNVPSGAWGTILDFFIGDAASAGNILAYGTLTASQSPTSGNTVKFAAGALTITLT
jgi:hypothetical protein